MVDAVYDAFVAAIGEVGGALVDDEAGIIKNLWPGGHLNCHAIAQDAEKMIAALHLMCQKARNLWLCPPQELAMTIPFRAKNACVGTLPRIDFDAAVAVTHDIQMHQGACHSVGLHSSDDARAYKLATIPISRVIVNQAHTFATGGSFTNGMLAVFAIHGLWDMGRQFG